MSRIFCRARHVWAEITGRECGKRGRNRLSDLREEKVTQSSLRPEHRGTEGAESRVAMADVQSLRIFGRFSCDAFLPLRYSYCCLRRVLLGSGPNDTHMIYVTQDLSRLFTSNIQSGTVSIWEKVRPSLPPGPPPPAGGPAPGPFPAEWSQFLVTVGAGSEGFDVSPDGKELWAANAQAGTIAVVNIAEKSVARTINANVRGANRLKFTPDGKLAFVSSLNGADVAVLDVGLKEVVKRIPVGHGAAGIQMEPNGARAFVACTPDNYVAVIDLKTLAG